MKSTNSGYGPIPDSEMKPTISQICSLNSPFAKDIEDYSAAGCKSIELWLGKLESWLEANSIDAYHKLLEQHEVRAPVASFQGGLLASQGQKRAEAWELFERRLKLCRELRIETLVVACDVMSPIDSDAVERTQMSLVQAAKLGEEQNTRLALEFQGKAAFGNNLQTAAALVAEVGSPHLGVCLDLFHFHAGPSKLADLNLLSSDNLFHVQLSDIADVPREFATDSHRIMPGEGDAPTTAVVDRLHEISYEGCVSIETMNPQNWQVPALQFGEVAMSSLQRLFAKP